MIYDMRCCRLENPAGVDRKKIEFSWKSTDFTRIRCVRILVSSTGEKCLEKCGDLWDSGYMHAVGRVFWKYQGKALKSHRMYYWTVEVIYESDGKEYCERGETQQFITGIDQNEWLGKWISFKSEMPDELYRKEKMFVKTLPPFERSEKIYAYVASYGYHDLYINGEKAHSRLLAPVRSRCTDYRKTVYATYDITQYLSEEKNSVQILTNAGWTRAERKVQPALNVQIYSEKGGMEIHTDTTWKVLDTGNITRDRYKDNRDNPYGWTDFGYEEICNLEPASHYEMSAGKEPEILSICPKIESEKTEKDMILQKLSPILTERQGVIHMDIGINFTGFLSVVVQLDGDREIVVKASDKKTESSSFGQQTRYIIKKGRHILKGHFQYIAGRYFEISGLKEEDQIIEAEGIMMGTQLMRTAVFRCSDPTLNRIFETDLHTFLSCTVGGVTMDCPHRERLGYGETGINTLIGCGLPCFESAAFYRNLFETWADCQERNGYFPHVVPDYHGGGGTAWSSFPVIGFYCYWQIYHDKDGLQEIYPALKIWCEYLNGKCLHGLLQRYEFGEWDFLGDWAAPERNDWGDSEEALFFNNGIYALVLYLMYELAEYMEYDEDAEIWKSRYYKLRKSINKKYFNHDEAVYCRNDAKYQALALLARLPSADHRRAVYNKMLDIVRKKGFLDGGSVGNTLLLQAMSFSREGNELIWQWLHRDAAPGYKYFLDKGETTWPEMWDIKDVYGGSRIHTCYTGIAGWMLYGLAGIRIHWGKDGLSCTAAPNFPEELKWVQIVYGTPLGKIRFEWNREET